MRFAEDLVEGFDNNRTSRIARPVLAMDAKELDEVIERSVRCTKGICAILQRGVTPDPHGEDKKKILSCEKSCELLFKTINRLDTLTDSTPDHAEKAACATAWLYAQIDWFDDIVGLLEAVKDQTAVVTSSSSSLLSRYGGL